MEHQVKSIRPFIGTANFNISRNFYNDLGFQETILNPNMSVFKVDGMAFYLQNYYAKEWIENTMIFLEVDSIDRYWAGLQQLNLTTKYKKVKLTPIKTEEWGKECFLHDPSGILWHFENFLNRFR